MIMLRKIASLAFLICIISPASVRGAEKFTLGKGIPQDVFLYLHHVGNPERAFVTEHWRSVYKAFEEIQFGTKLHSLFIDSVPEEDRPAFTENWNKAVQLLKKVDWFNLCDREMVIASRIKPPMPEFIFLGRSSPEHIEKNATALADLLAHAATLNEEFSVKKTGSGANQQVTLHFESLDLQLRMIRRGDLLALSFDNGLSQQVFDMLEGKDETPSILDSPRFKNAMSKLPKAEDRLAFVDINGLLKGVGAAAEAIIPSPAEGTPGDVPDPKTIVNKFLGHLEIFDYLASTGSMDGRTAKNEILFALSPDAESSKLYPVIANQKPFENFDKYIPAEAVGFRLWSGADLSALYKFIIEFVEKEIPGESPLANLKKMEEDNDFDIDRDLLSWISGEIISIQLPAATPNAFSTKDSVFLLRVKDDQVAKEKVDALAKRLVTIAQQMNQPLMLQPVPDLKGFMSLTHPMLAMLLRPIFGVQDGWLIVGTTEPALKTVLATAAGKHDTIAKSERFQKEGLIPKGPVSNMSYTDLSNLGTELSQMVAIFSFVGQMLPGQQQGQLQAPEGAQPQESSPNAAMMSGMRSLLGMAGEIAPVLTKLDFFQSSASICNFDGSQWRTTSIVNYKPEKPKAAPAPSDAKPATN